MSQARGYIKECVLGVATATLFSAVLILIVALFTKFFPAADAAVTVLNIAVKGLSVFLGVVTQVKGSGKGLFKGAFIGAAFSLISLVILLLLGGKFDLGTYCIDLGICAATGILSGILFANRKR